MRYDWFLTTDGTECELRELYPDAQAFAAQHAKTAEATAVLAGGQAAYHRHVIVGDPDQGVLSGTAN
jgi:hypothetical protein